MKRLLFVIYENGNMTTALDLAYRGRTTGKFQTIIWCPYYSSETERHRALAATAGAPFVHETSATGGLADIWTPLSGYWHDIPKRLPVKPPRERKAPARLILAVDNLEANLRGRILQAADRCQRRMLFCEDLLVRLDVDAVAFSEDNPERDSFGWIAAAAKRSIPTTIVSYGALSPHEAQEAYRYSEAHRVEAPLLELFKQELPHWLREGAVGPISRMPPIEALGRVLAGFDRRDPWIVNAGDVGRICLESRRMHSVYLAHGFASEQIEIVGAPAFDRLHAAKQDCAVGRERLTALGIDPHAALVVIAMPPDQTSNRSLEFGNYCSVLDVFTQTPRSLTGAEIVVTPHPNISAEHNEFLSVRGIVVMDVPASELIPLADLYIASVSSTIKWALACGVPVINYDIYGYQYTEFAATDAVRTVFDYAGFVEALKDWGDPLRRVELQGVARAGAGEWGSLDGRACDRILDQVFRIIDPTTSPTISKRGEMAATGDYPSNALDRPFIQRSETYLGETRANPVKENFLFLAETIAKSPLPAPLRFLDVGCATGDLVAFASSTFPDAIAVGIDNDEILIEAARARIDTGSAEFRLGDALSYRGAPANIVCCFGMLGIFDSFEPLLENLLANTAPGGSVYVFGLMNSDDIDVSIRYRDNTYGDIWHRGFNIFSCQQIRHWLGRRNLTGSFYDFRMKSDLPKRPKFPHRAHSLILDSGERRMINGLGMILPEVLLEIHMPLNSLA
jgi:SAM-dependent methyltransferase